MAPQRFNYYPPGQPQFAAAYARRAPDYELVSHQGLASSQPVSLIQLYKKTTSSRNKASRSSRAFLADSADYMEKDADALHRSDTYEPYSQHYNTREDILSNEAGHLLSPPRFVPRGYPWQRHGTHTEIGQQQSWHPHLNNYQIQETPLSFASHHGNPSQLRNHSSMSESPVLRKMDRCLPDNETWPVEDATVSQTAPFDTSYPQKMQSTKEYMPASALQIYRDSFDRPQNKSSHEPFRPKHRKNWTDLPSITSGLQYGHYPQAMYGNTTIRSEPRATTNHRARLPDILDSAETMRETLATHRPRDDFEPPKVPATHPRLSSGTNISQRTIKEDIYATLDNLSLGPNSDCLLTSYPQDGESTETVSVTIDEKQEPLNRRNPILLELEEHTRDELELEQGDSIEPKEDGLVAQAHGAEQDLTKRPCEVDKERLKIYGTDFPHFADQLPAPSCSHKSTDGTIKFPQGLFRRSDTESPFPSVMSSTFLEVNKWSHISKCGQEQKPIPSPASARLLQVNKWFHTDNSGDGRFCQRIAHIAENYVESREHLNEQAFSEQDNITAKQLITIMGGVFANLSTYTPQDLKDPARYFANFEPVASHYCEPPMGNLRSSFDYDPTFDSWRYMDGVSLDNKINL